MVIFILQYKLFKMSFDINIFPPFRKQHRCNFTSDIVRHHFRVVGTSENGEELVTFASSEYPEKPTLQQIQRSIDRYRVCLTMYGDTISDEIEKVDLSVYMFTD